LAGGFAKLADSAIFIGWIFYGLGAAAIFPIRRDNQGKQIPYRVPGYPVTPILFVLAALALVGNAIYAAIKDPHEFTYLLAALGLMLLGLPGYFFWSRQQVRDSAK
jgi:APA family basic amino acid/polyamine antiporter